MYFIFRQMTFLRQNFAENRKSGKGLEKVVVQLRIFHFSHPVLVLFVVKMVSADGKNTLFLVLQRMQRSALERENRRSAGCEAVTERGVRSGF